MKHFQPSVQDVLLRRLVDNYPNLTPQHELQGDFPDPVFDFNLFYLWDHGLIRWWDRDIGDDRTQRQVRITAKGIDQLRLSGLPAD